MNSTWNDLPLGKIVFSSVDTPIFKKGMLGVVCEHYQGHEGEHFSIIFINGEKEGFAPSEIKLFLDLTSESMSLHGGTKEIIVTLQDLANHFNYEEFLIKKEKQLLEKNIIEPNEYKKLKL
jgi:hypothetical protein